MTLPTNPGWVIVLPDWKTILTKAWSVRWMTLAVLLSACEVGLPQIGAESLPAGVFALLSGIVSVAAIVSRVLAQKSMGD